MNTFTQFTRSTQFARITVLAALSAFALGAHAEGSAKSAAAAASAAAGNKAEITQAEKNRLAEMVCTSQRVTGSRMARRVCHSREEVEMMQRAGRETVEKIQEMPLPLKGE